MNQPTLQWIDPGICTPPHKVTHPDRAYYLAQSLQDYGWRKGEPYLLAYDNKAHDNAYGWVQLISGSHRWAVARRLNVKIPVALYTYNDVYAYWGRDEWLQLMRNPPRLSQWHDLQLL